MSQTVTEDTDNDGSFEDETPSTTAYLYDRINPTGYAQILEEAINETLAKSYTLGLDVIAQQAPAVQSGSNLFLLYDGHGSTRMLVDATGQPLSNQVFRYDAFGNRLDSNTALTSLLYSGELTDATGLQYLRARYYDPASGRFNRLDPFFGRLNDPQSLHKYLYCGADPVNHTDPLGLYGIGFHYYVISYILRSLGWPRLDAHLVARWSQYVDDNSYTKATTPILHSVALSDFKTEEQVRSWFHFHGSAPTKGTVMNDPSARQHLLDAKNRFYARYQPGAPVNDLDAINLGIWLHIYADTFSHAGFSAWHSSVNVRNGIGLPIGHVDTDYMGHAPDMISLSAYNHVVANMAIENIYDILRAGSPYTVLPQSKTQTLTRLSTTLYCGGVAYTFGAEGESIVAARIMDITDAHFGFGGGTHMEYDAAQIFVDNSLVNLFKQAIGIRNVLPNVRTTTSRGDVASVGFFVNV